MPGLIAAAIFLLCGCETDVSLQITPPTTELQRQTSASAPGWPAIYGPTGNSISRETNVNTLWGPEGPPVLWERKIGRGYSTPVATADRVIVFYRKDDHEILECLDSTTSEVVWNFRRPTTFECGWEQYSDGPYSTPLIVEDSIYCISAEGTLYCVALETGALRWSRDLFADYGLPVLKWPVVASPAVYNDRLIFNLGASEQNAGIVSLDLNDGSTIWEATSHAAGHTTPCIATIHGRPYAFVLTAVGLVCLDPDNGSVYWEIAHAPRNPDGMYSNAVSPVVYDDKVVIVTGPHVKPGIRCFQILPDSSYVEPWSDIRLLNSQYTNPVVIGGYLFGMTPMKQGGPEMKCIDLQTGNLAWKGQPEIGRANAIAVGDAIILFGERGQLAAIEISMRGMNILSRSENSFLKAPCYSPFAVSNGLLFLRNERKLVCLDLRAR